MKKILVMILLYSVGIPCLCAQSVESPTGVSATNGTYADKIVVTWDPVSCSGGCTPYYQVYRYTCPSGCGKVAVTDWQTGTQHSDYISATERSRYYYYVVRTATDAQGSNSSDFSPADQGHCKFLVIYQPDTEYTLTLSSTRGGMVFNPGEGEFRYKAGTAIPLAAEPDPLFAFDRWEGCVEDTRAEFYFAIREDCSLKACFQSVLATLYVDDDAHQDPGPVDEGISDPLENGTLLHPFDSIQESIDVARDGATIVVKQGYYNEVIDFLGKNIRVMGWDPNDANQVSLPVIDGQNNGPVVTFDQCTASTCLLSGFVITRGKGAQAGAIVCTSSSPTIANCVIVGNRCDETALGAVVLQGGDPTLQNCTISNNVASIGGAGLYIDGNANVVNCIITGNSPRDVIVPINEFVPHFAYCCTSGIVNGIGNFNLDPFFVTPGTWGHRDFPEVTMDPLHSDAEFSGGDYHLKSWAGHWNSIWTGWFIDPVNSACIDAGDPSALPEYELVPHGSRTNIGAYGNTPWASKSYIFE
ncbi:right-handed parallel beta-helix repeat-containing protein [Planctomycetota bacterium]